MSVLPRRLAPGAALLLVALTAAPTTEAHGPAPVVRAVTATPSPAPTPGADAITIDAVTPAFVIGRKPVTLRGTVTVGNELRAPSVLVTATGALPTRYELGSTLTTPQVPGQYAAQAGLGPAVAAGSTVPWTVTVPADRLPEGRDAPAVAVLGVQLRGVRDGAGRVTVATGRVPVAALDPDAHFRPTRLALVWPLVATPPRGSNGTYLDDAVGAALAPNGRLQVLLATGSRPRPPTTRGQPFAAPHVTWSVDPALLQAAADLRGGYTVRDPDTHDARRPGSHAADAGGWLDTALKVLRPADGEGRLLELPYADPDVAALDRAGLGQDVATAVRRGGQVVRQLLGTPPREDLLWPPGGLPPSALDGPAPGGATGLLLDGDQLPPLRDPGYTPSAGATLQTGAGPVTALASDGALSRVLAAGSRGATPDPAVTAPGERPTAATLVGRVLAETAVLTAELPSRSRDVVVTPPRRWDPEPLVADTLVSQLAAAPWVQLTGLQQLRDDPPDPTPRAATPRYAPAAAARELSRDYLLQRPNGVAAQEGRLAALRSILADASSTVTLRYDLALLREESSAWRDDLPTGDALRRGVAGDLNRDVGSVRIASRGLITLASSKGLLPITLQNDLDQPVTVRLQLHAASSARLGVSDDTLHTVAAHRKRTLQIEAEARTAGVFRVQAQLLTPDADPQDRRPVGAPVELRVRSTAYGAIAVAITVGGLVLLAAAIAVRLARRVLRARRARGGPTAA